MKKTLHALLLLPALATTSFSLSLEDAVLVQSKTDSALQPSTSLTGEALFTGDFTVSAKLNVDWLTSTLVKGGSITGAAYGFVSMADANNAHVVGTFSGYSSTNDKINRAGIYASSVTATTAGTPASNTYKALSTNPTESPLDINSSLADIDWSRVLDASLTLAYDADYGTTVYLTLGYDNASIVNYYGSNTTWHWSRGVGDWVTLEVNTNVVDSVYLMKGVASQADALSINSRLVPEPAAATLFLLSLAGLAARRRRK